MPSGSQLVRRKQTRMKTSDEKEVFLQCDVGSDKNEDILFGTSRSGLVIITHVRHLSILRT